MAIFRRGPPNGASNAGGVGTNRDCRSSTIDRSMTVEVVRLTVIRAVVYNSYGARLFTAETATHQWIRRTEENRTEFYLRSGKSQAEIRLIIEDCARRIVQLKLTTDRHEASRGLSATVGLLVLNAITLDRYSVILQWQKCRSVDTYTLLSRV